MKVAFPLRNKRELAIDFVRCDTIGIYDISSEHIEYLPPSDSEEFSSDRLFEQLQLIGVECVVSPYFSCTLLQTLKSGNIKTYKARSEKLEDNLKWMCMSILCLFSAYDTLLCDECPKDCHGCQDQIH